MKSEYDNFYKKYSKFELVWHQKNIHHLGKALGIDVNHSDLVLIMKSAHLLEIRQAKDG